MCMAVSVLKKKEEKKINVENKTNRTANKYNRRKNRSVTHFRKVMENFLLIC